MRKSLVLLEFEGLASLRRDADCARVPRAQDPALRDIEIQQCGTECAAKMRTPLREIHAGAREHSFGAPRGGKVDTERSQLLFPKPRHAEVLSVGAQPARFEHRLEDGHRRLTGQMVVAGSATQKRA